MSVICCKIEKDRIEIASDSIRVYGSTQSKGSNTTHTKLMQVNDMTFGSSGTCQEASLFSVFCLTHKPKAPTVEDILTFYSEFASWQNDKVGKFDVKNDYIFICEKTAFSVNGFFVDKIKTYDAIGAGMDYALSALYLGHGVSKAVDVACELSVYCEAPINKIIIDL